MIGQRGITYARVCKVGGQGFWSQFAIAEYRMAVKIDQDGFFHNLMHKAGCALAHPAFF
jgi:hypothetical protein